MNVIVQLLGSLGKVRNRNQLIHSLHLIAYAMCVRSNKETEEAVRRCGEVAFDICGKDFHDLVRRQSKVGLRLQQRLLVVIRSQFNTD